MKTLRNLATGWKSPVFQNGEKNITLPLSLPIEKAGKTVTLTREITVPEDEKTSAYYLCTRFLSGKCKVFLNDVPVREYRGLFAPRITDLTPVLKKGEPQTLRLEITPAARPDGLFTFGGAALYGTGLSHFTLSDKAAPISVRTVFTDEGVRVLMHAEIENPNNYDVVLFRLCSPDGILIDVKSARPTAADACFDLHAPLKWDGLHAAYKYRAEVILQRDSDIIDLAETSFGIREFKPGDHGFFTLNGISLPLNGAALHDAGTEKDLACLQELDANLVGLSSLDPKEELLDRCDALGIMVFFMYPDNMDDDEDMTELKCLTRLLAAHPSVVFMGYRSDDPAYAKKFCAAVKQNAPDIYTVGKCDLLDADRLADAIPDVLLLHYEVGTDKNAFQQLAARMAEISEAHPDYRFAVFPKAPECIFDRHSAGAARPDCSQEYFSMWHENVWEVFGTQKNVACYFTGFLGDRSAKAERTGLTSFDRAEKKDAFWFYKARFSAGDFVKLASLPASVTQKTVDVKCYTNARRMTLLVNGKTKKRYTPVRLSESVYVFQNVKLKRKNNTLVLSCEAGTDSTGIFRSKSKLGKK